MFTPLNAYGDNLVLADHFAAPFTGWTSSFDYLWGQSNAGADRVLTHVFSAPPEALCSAAWRMRYDAQRPLAGDKFGFRFLDADGVMVAQLEATVAADPADGNNPFLVNWTLTTDADAVGWSLGGFRFRTAATGAVHTVWVNLLADPAAKTVNACFHNTSDPSDASWDDAGASLQYNGVIAKVEAYIAQTANLWVLNLVALHYGENPFFNPGDSISQRGLGYGVGDQGANAFLAVPYCPRTVSGSNLLTGTTNNLQDRWLGHTIGQGARRIILGPIGTNDLGTVSGNKEAAMKAAFTAIMEACAASAQIEQVIVVSILPVGDATHAGLRRDAATIAAARAINAHLFAECRRLGDKFKLCDLYQIFRAGVTDDMALVGADDGGGIGGATGTTYSTDGQHLDNTAGYRRAGLALAMAIDGQQPMAGSYDSAVTADKGNWKLFDNITLATGATLTARAITRNGKTLTIAGGKVKWLRREGGLIEADGSRSIDLTGAYGFSGE
jgi:hypothetical protein